MKRASHFLVLPLLLALAAGCATVPPRDATSADAGAAPPSFADSAWLPFFGTLADPDGTTRTRAVGPFRETASSPSGATLSAPFRPFFAESADPAADRTNWDSLWPLAHGKTFHREKSWRIVNAYWRDADPSDPAAAYRFMIFPFWFNGRDETGRTHAGLFPVAGTVDHFLMKDHVAFFLFPLWMRSQVNDVTTTDVLWPIYSRTTSPDRHYEKFRIFPFYARSARRGQYDKTSILWPFWTHARYDFPASHGTSWLLFPIAGRVNLSDQKGIAILPPLFTRVVNTNGTSRTQILWPIFRRDTGPRPLIRVWPFYGHRTDGPLDKKFWLWPIVTREENAWGEKHYLRWSVAPFYSRRTLDRIPADPDAAPSRLVSRTQFWPLFTHTYSNENGEDASRLAIPDLWPGPTPAPVARSWAPLWTLYERRAAGESSQTDVLWGFWHSESAPDRSVNRLFPFWGYVSDPAADTERHWSVLKGLLAYDRDSDQSRRLRLLWIPIPLGSADDPPAEAVDPEEESPSPDPAPAPDAELPTPATP